MKTYCKNFVIDEAHVRAAYVLWMQSGAGRKNMHRIFAEHGSPSELIREITQEIRDRTLALRPIRRYPRYEPSNGKTRLIGIASVKQQICDYVAVLALEQFLAAKVGHYQVASVKGKGQLFAARTIKKWVNDGGYWVHLDIRKCYPSIKTDLVMGMIEKYVRSEDVRYVVRAIFSRYDGCLEIGSYLSLRLAQMVLSFGYHHVEGLGKERRGKRRPLISHQLWYMDDILLMSPDKRDLKAAIRSLAGFMAGMGLEVKPWKVCRVGDDEPIDMAGFVMRPGRVTVRDTIFLRASRAYRQFDRRPTLAGARRVCSYWGWFKHTDSRGFMANSNIQEINTRARRMVAAAERMSA